MKKLKRIYKSLEEALKQIEDQSKYHPNLKDPFHRQSVTGAYSFTETKSIEEAIDLARYGWPKGKEIIKKLTKDHENLFHKLFPSQDFDIKITNDHEGEVVNMDNYLSGQPEDMMTFGQDEERIKKLSSGKMQRIIVYADIAAYISTDAVFNRGAIISSMINIMELYGFRTELWAYQSSYIGDNHSAYIFKLKNFDEDLDLNKLSFVFCHPSMTRRIQFALLEQEENGHFWVSHNYGYPKDISSDKILSEFGSKETLNYGNIYFECLTCNKTFKQLLDGTELKLKEHFTSIKI